MKVFRGHDETVVELHYNAGTSSPFTSLKAVDSCYQYIGYSWNDCLLECIDSGCIVFTNCSLLCDRCQDHYGLPLILK